MHRAPTLPFCLLFGLQSLIYTLLFFVIYHILSNLIIIYSIKYSNNIERKYRVKKEKGKVEKVYTNIFYFFPLLKIYLKPILKVLL
jgi:hypothetical protein